MYQLDPVGRLAPSSLDVSRAAARRHAALAALDNAPVSSQSSPRGRRLSTRWARSARVVASRAPAIARATRGAHPSEVQW